MKPLTNTVPKPLLKVGQRSLIEWQIFALKNAGVEEVVVNVSWLADQVMHSLGSGRRYGIKIVYSHEGDAIQGTAGGILRALPLLGDQPFILCNADVWSDFDYRRLQLHGSDLVQIVLTKNPEHNASGDFSIDASRLIEPCGATLTYAGIGIYSPSLFAELANGERALAPLLTNCIARQSASALEHNGIWIDVGTPERLQKANQYLTNRT